MPCGTADGVELGLTLSSSCAAAAISTNRLHTSPATTRSLRGIRIRRLLNDIVSENFVVGGGLSSSGVFRLNALVSATIMHRSPTLKYILSYVENKCNDIS